MKLKRVTALLAEHNINAVYVEAAQNLDKIWRTLLAIAKSKSSDKIKIKGYHSSVELTYNGDVIDYAVYENSTQVLDGEISQDSESKAVENSVKTLKAVIEKVFNSYVTYLETKIGEITNAYLDAALFSTTYHGNDSTVDPNDTFKEIGYSTDAFSAKALKAARADIKRFLVAIQKSKGGLSDLSSYMVTVSNKPSSFGHDFWMSRDGSGSGFFIYHADVLQRLAENFGAVDLYANDDTAEIDFQ